MKLAQFLVRLYPQLWRRRYEDEFMALLELQPISLLDGIDLFLGALDAHLHPHFGVTALSLAERIQLMLSTLRRSLLTIFCAYSVFIIAGIGFQKLNEDRNFVEAAQVHTGIGLSFNLVVIGAIVALLAVVAGGLPVVTAIIRDALTRKRYGPLFLLATPVIAMAAFIGTIFLLEAFTVRASLLPALLSRGIFIAIFLGTTVVSTGALCFAVARSDIPAQSLRFALLPSLLTVLAMAIMSIATLVWGLSLRSNVPQLFNSNAGIFGTSTSGTWLKIVLMMAIATVLAIISLVRGWSARSALPATAA